MYLLSVILNSNKSLSPWNSILNTDIPPNEIYSHVYEKPQSMHEGDLNWRILYGAISTAKFCFRSGYERSDLCPYCGKQEDLTYLFLSCKRLEPLVRHVQNILECIISDTASLLTFDLGPTAVGHTDQTPTQVSDQSSPVCQPSSKASCPARGLTPASQTSSRISCPVQRNQQKTPVDQSSSQASCPVQTTETAYPVDSTPHRVNCPVTMQPLLMEDGTVVLGECTNTQRWIKARRIPRRLFLWAIYVTSQHLISGGGETEPLVEFRNRVRTRLKIEYAYYRFVNNIDFWCFNYILCSIVGDKLIVNV